MPWGASTKIITIFYGGGIPPGGWSEVYYITEPDYEAALTIAENIRDLRIAMMPDSFQARYIRVSDPNIRGDAIINSAVVTGTYGAENEPALPASTCLLIRMVSNADWVPSFRYFHGLPECVNQAGNFTPAVCTATPSFQDELDACLDYLEANVLMYQKNGPGPDDFDLFGINQLTAVRLTNKRIGRPFGLTRGRSPNCPLA